MNRIDLQLEGIGIMKTKLLIYLVFYVTPSTLSVIS